MNEFDGFSESYDSDLARAVGPLAEDVDLFAEVKVDALLGVVREVTGPPEKLAFLDVGCGTGRTTGLLAPRVREVRGIDVSPAMVERARREHPDVAFSAFDGRGIPAPDASVDVAFAVCVVHHVPPGQWASFVAEMARVVRPGGLVALLEHNPLNPLTRLVVSRCLFDEHAVLLRSGTARDLLRGAGAEPLGTRFVLFFPWRGRGWRCAERPLRRLPAGAQYVAAGVRR